MIAKLLSIFVCTLALSYSPSTATNPVDFWDSNILSGETYFRKLLASWLPGKGTWTICWRASCDGWAASRFHAGCDDKGPTVTIVQVGRYIFGGYTDVSWSGDRYKLSPKTFIFSLRNKLKLAPFRSYPNSAYHQNYAVYADPLCGPTFGGGHDLYISSNSNSNRYSYTNFGYTFSVPRGYYGGNGDSKQLLAGTYKFKPTEVEVYYLH